MKEIKEILNKYEMTGAYIEGAKRVDYKHYDDLAKQHMVEELETLINSHYIAKERVLGLKMVKTKAEVEKRHFGKQENYFELIKAISFSEGYNQAVSEINKKVDDLVEETEQC